MQTKGLLDQEAYWVYETHKNYMHAPIFRIEPRTLMVFKTKDDARAFEPAFLLLPILKLRSVSRQELESIIKTEFAGNYCILESTDVFLVASRYEFAPVPDCGDVPEA